MWLQKGCESQSRSPPPPASRYTTFHHLWPRGRHSQCRPAECDDSTGRRGDGMGATADIRRAARPLVGPSAVRGGMLSARRPARWKTPSNVASTIGAIEVRPGARDLGLLAPMQKRGVANFRMLPERTEERVAPRGALALMEKGCRKTCRRGKYRVLIDSELRHFDVCSQIWGASRNPCVSYLRGPGGPGVT